MEESMTTQELQTLLALARENERLKLLEIVRKADSLQEVIRALEQRQDT